MTTNSIHTAHASRTLTIMRRAWCSALALAACFILLSASAAAQGSPHIQFVQDMDVAAYAEHETEAALPLNYGLPAVAKRMPAMVYPVRAMQFQIEGRVIVEFVVNQKGRVIRSTILKKVGYGCDQEVVRVLRLTRFEPALDATGKPQSARYLAAFDFSLDS